MVVLHNGFTSTGSKYLENISRTRIQNKNGIIIIIIDINQNAIIQTNTEIISTSPVLKRHSRGILLQAKRDCCDRVHSDQTILRTDKQEAGPQERRPKALKTKLTQGGPSGLSPFRLDGSHDGQAGGWTS